jgi:hypothetical protein
MVSLTFFSYLLVREWAAERYLSFGIFFVVTFIYETFMSVNVVFIGTHTISEVVGGWICALFLVTFYLRIENQMLSYFRRQLVSRALKAIAFVVFITLIGDALDSILQDRFLLGDDSDEWIESMASTCNQTLEVVREKIQLHMNYSNTPLMFGLITGYACWAALFPRSNLSSWNLYLRYRALICGKDKIANPGILWRGLFVVIGFSGLYVLGHPMLKIFLPKMIRIVLLPLWIFMGPRVFLFLVLQVLEFLFAFAHKDKKKLQ